MPRYIIDYDVENGSNSEYKAVKEAIRAHCTSAQKRLETTWVANSRFITADNLRDGLVSHMRNNTKLGKKFVRERLDLVVGMLDRRADEPLKWHNTSVLDDC